LKKVISKGSSRRDSSQEKLSGETLNLSQNDKEKDKNLEGQRENEKVKSEGHAYEDKSHIPSDTGSPKEIKNRKIWKKKTK